MRRHRAHCDDCGFPVLLVTPRRDLELQTLAKHEKLIEGIRHECPGSGRAIQNTHREKVTLDHPRE